MEQSSKQQATELIKKSSNILIIGNSGPTGDTIGSIIGLASILKKIGKQTTAIVSEQVPENLSFLPNKELLSQDISGVSDFVIAVNVKKKGLEKLSYNKEGDVLNIILTANGEKIKPEDISFTEAPNFDLIIVLDTPDVDRLDRIYDKYVDMFFKIPVINIDHHAGNEYFGVVNLVDITATSSAEILTALIDGLGSSLLDEKIATCLLTGIIDDTASFKNMSTTPKSFTVSAQLLAAGANQQEIINNLYKSKSLNTLKLWGRILDGLTLEENSVWAALNNKQYVDLSANIEDIYGVINELLATIPEANTVIIFVEDVPGETRIIIRSKKDGNASDMSQLFGVTGGKSEAVLQLMGDPFEIAKKFFDRVKNRKSAMGKSLAEEKKEKITEVILKEETNEKTEEKKNKTTQKNKDDVNEQPKKIRNIFAEEDDENEDAQIDDSVLSKKSNEAIPTDEIGIWRP